MLLDNLYVVGGFDGKDALSSVERYDAVTDRWCHIMPLGGIQAGVPYGKRSWLAACTFHGAIYVLGGHDNHQPEDEDEDSTVIQGTSLATVEVTTPTPRRGLSTHPSLQRFVVEKNRWERLADMQVPRSSLCCAAIDDGFSVH